MSILKSSLDFDPFFFPLMCSVWLLSSVSSWNEEIQNRKKNTENTEIILDTGDEYEHFDSAH